MSTKRKRPKTSASATPYKSGQMSVKNRTRNAAFPYRPAHRLKFYDFQINSGTTDVHKTVAANSNFVWPSFIGIASGSDNIDRNAAHILIKKLHMRLRLSVDASVATGSPPVRVILYVDKECQGVAAVCRGDNFKGILAADSDTEAYVSFNNLFASKRFTILMDKTVVVQENVSEDNAHMMEFHKDLNLPVQYDGDTGAISEIPRNNIGLLIVTGDFPVNVFGKTRVRFLDA